MVYNDCTYSVSFKLSSAKSFKDIRWDAMLQASHKRLRNLNSFNQSSTNNERLCEPSPNTVISRRAMPGQKAGKPVLFQSEFADHSIKMRRSLSLPMKYVGHVRDSGNVLLHHKILCPTGLHSPVFSVSDEPRTP